MANLFIADIHAGCVNYHDERTLETDKIIKSKWNRKTTNGDTVYILGDIGKEGGNKEIEYLCEFYSTLKGKKILIQGNHEKLKDIRLRQLFTEIVPYKEIVDNSNGKSQKLILSHYPILMWNQQHKGSIHLYGHVHMSDEWVIYNEALNELNDYFACKTLKGKNDCPKAYAYNVGCMLPYMDYEPRTLDEIMKGSEMCN